MSKTQNDIFLKSEGNAWFKRNQSCLGSAEAVRKDAPLSLLRKSGLRFKNVLEAGCSNGWRLAEIQKKFRCSGTGIDASTSAIRKGRKLYPKITFKRGDMARLPFKDGTFDLVIVYFVFHWVDRKLLLKCIGEIDRVLKDGGHLIIGDFLPGKPVKNVYHHLPKNQVYTYKLNYSECFLAAGTYRTVERIIFNHDHAGKLSDANRAGCFLLRKSVGGFYGAQKKAKA